MGTTTRVGYAQGVDAMFYVDKTGCQWEMLPKDYPNHNSVYYHFARWSDEGRWEQMNTALREQLRVQLGRQAQPSAASVDSQSVKTTTVGGEHIQGRKRHILVDTMGNLLKVIVTVANMSDGKAAIALLKTLPQIPFKRLKRLWADGGYRGEFVKWVAKKFKKIIVDITLRSDDLKGFEVVPWRWLGAYRRLSKDYEFFTHHSEGIIYLASIHRLLHRLAPAQ